MTDPHTQSLSMPSPPQSPKLLHRLKRNNQTTPTTVQHSTSHLLINANIPKISVVSTRTLLSTDPLSPPTTRSTPSTHTLSTTDPLIPQQGSTPCAPLPHVPPSPTLRSRSTISTLQRGTSFPSFSIPSYVNNWMFYACLTLGYGTLKTSCGTKQLVGTVSGQGAPSTLHLHNLSVASQPLHTTKSIQLRSGDNSSSRVQESHVRSAFARTPLGAGQSRPSILSSALRIST